MGYLDPLFQKRIDEAEINRKDLKLACDHLEHSIYASEKIMQMAKKDIKIITGTLPEKFFNRKEIRTNLGKKAEEIPVKIIVQLPWLPQNKSFYQFANRVGIKIRDMYDWRIETLHFLVSDGLAFKVEKPHKYGESNRENTINFNNEHLGGILSRHFDDAWYC